MFAHSMALAFVALLELLPVALLLLLLLAEVLVPLCCCLVNRPSSTRAKR
jgi:hypothetical protein